MSMSETGVILFRAAGVPVGIVHRNPGIAAVFAFGDVPDTRERQMGRGNQVFIFHKFRKRVFAHACRFVLIFIVGNGHVRLRELNRRGMNDVADKGDLLAVARQRVEG